MNGHTRQLLENLQDLKDPHGFRFEGTGDWIGALASNPFPEGNGSRLDMICADDGTMIVVQGHRFNGKTFDSPEDWKALLRAQSRYRLLRFMTTQAGPLLTPRLEFFLPARELPPKNDLAYGTMLDLSLVVLAPVMAYLGKRVRDGIWDEDLIKEDPPELKALTEEIRTMEDQIQAQRRRADFLREAVAPGSRVLPNFI